MNKQRSKETRANQANKYTATTTQLMKVIHVVSKPAFNLQGERDCAVFWQTSCIFDSFYNGAYDLITAFALLWVWLWFWFWWCVVVGAFVVVVVIGCGCGCFCYHYCCEFGRGCGCGCRCCFVSVDFVVVDTDVSNMPHYCRLPTCHMPATAILRASHREICPLVDQVWSKDVDLTLPLMWPFVVLLSRVH